MPLRRRSAPRRPRPFVRLDLRRSMPENSATRRVSALNSIALRKRDQMPVVGFVHGEPGERHLELHVVVECHELLRQPRVSALSISDCRRLSCLMSPARASSVSRSPYSAMSCAAVFTPMPGHARNVVGGIPDQRLHLDDLPRRHPEFLDHLRDADLAILHGVVHDDAIGHELHQVLVGGDDGRGRARLAGLAHVGGDQVVRLEARLLQARQVEGAHRLADQRELGAEVIGRVGSVGLVVRIHVGPECLLRLVEHDREVASAARPVSCRASASTACCRSRARR